MTRKLLIQSIALALATGGIAACGGGGGGGDGTPTGASTTTVGTITGFGSIYVNGVEYETDSATFDIDDDQSLTEADLEVGMKVKVEGTVNADGVTGTATSVFYDDDVEGPIDDGSLSDDPSTNPPSYTFTIFGLQVLVEAGNTTFEDTTYTTLTDADIVEVSGYFDGTQVVATHIEKQDDLDDEFEVKGTVTTYNAGIDITVELQNGALVTATIDANTELDFSGDPTGQFVEIEMNASLVALEIEIDDEDLLDDDDEDVSIQGVLAGDATSGWFISGVEINFDDAEFEPASLEDNLVAGLALEVEGDMVGGVLIADEVEAADGDIEIEGEAGLVTGDTKVGSVEVLLGAAGSVTVNTDTGTMIHDDGVALNLSDLGSCVAFEVEAYQDDLGDLVATSVECDNSLDEYSIEGPVDSYDRASGAVTVLGANYTVVDGLTSFDEGSLSYTAFFDALDDGGAGIGVEIEDTDGDGVAEEAEIED